MSRGWCVCVMNPRVYAYFNFIILLNYQHGTRRYRLNAPPHKQLTATLPPPALLALVPLAVASEAHGHVLPLLFVHCALALGGH